MSNISIHRVHRLSDAAARRVAQEVATELSGRFGLNTSWEGDTLRFKRLGLDGTLRLQPGRVGIEITLGMLIGVYRATIEQAVNEQLDLRFVEKPKAKGKKGS